MKITRKQLRQFIVESLKDQGVLVNEANLAKYQKILGKAKQVKAKKGSQEYKDAERASQELSAMKHGDPLPPSGKVPKKGPFKKEGSPRYQKADELLNSILDFLEAAEG